MMTLYRCAIPYKTRKLIELKVIEESVPIGQIIYRTDVTLEEYSVLVIDLFDNVANRVLFFDLFLKRNPDGSIVFINSTGTDTKYCNSIAPFWPIVGDLFVFSGKQMHGVYPFRTKDGKGERRSIAFNATVKTNFGEVAMKETAVGSAIEEKFMEEEKSK